MPEVKKRRDYSHNCSFTLEATFKEQQLSAVAYFLHTVSSCDAANGFRITAVRAKTKYKKYSHTYIVRNLSQEQKNNFTLLTAI